MYKFKVESQQFTRVISMLPWIYLSFSQTIYKVLVEENAEYINV